MPKKKTALTIEERLQQALVPAEEQPYEVPENWVWVRLGAFAETISKGTTPKGGSAAYVDEGVNFLRVENLTSEGYISHSKITHITEEMHENYLKRSILKANDLLISIAGSLGKSAIVRECDLPINTNQAIAFVRLFADKIDVNYIRNTIESPLINSVLTKQTKVTSIPNLTLEIIKDCPIPLPPLSEQQRIVERIEELFVKLDEAKERLQEAADSFAVRKAAILHKAFTGELIGKQVTELVPLENLVDLIKIGPFGLSLHESDYIENGIPLVNPKHIVQQRIVPQSKISISDEKAEELSSYKLKENDIVLGRRGEMGRCAPISNREENWICGTGSMIIRLKKEYDAKLYSLILGSQATVTYLENSAVGSTLKNLNEKIVRKIPVPQFSSEEQHEIVRLIDDLLAREHKAQQATEQALASIDLMKKSILARAFRGELSTNKASEASALELLKQVLAEN